MLEKLNLISSMLALIEMTTEIIKSPSISSRPVSAKSTRKNGKNRKRARLASYIFSASFLLYPSGSICFEISSLLAVATQPH
jgi:hypothetical protein